MVEALGAGEARRPDAWDARDATVDATLGMPTDGVSARIVQEVVALLARKWVLPILRELSKNPMRYTQLVHAIDGIRPKILTDTLRSLERHGAVQRVLFKDPYGNLGIGYQLTALGRTLSVPLRSLHAWGSEHLDEVHRAQGETDRPEDYRRP